MNTSFHTHTYLCKHASGTVSDYVKQAELEHCDVLGFSDHCPFPHDGTDNWQGVKMEVEEAELYVNAVRKAAKETSFPIYLGFECEWDSFYKNWYEDYLLGELKSDYLVLGQHWVTDGELRRYIPECCTGTLLHRWTDMTIEAIQTGYFAFLAHPDVLMAHGAIWTDDIKSCLTAITDAAIAYDMPLEVNGNGLARPMLRTPDGGSRHPYPVDEYWQIVAEKGAKVICNSDAHNPEAVLSYAKKAKEYASKFGLKPIENIF